LQTSNRFYSIFHMIVQIYTYELTRFSFACISCLVAIRSESSTI
jgi:hypothetical protein